VTLTIADDLPLIYVDPSLIESALGQVIENAAKYSPADKPITIVAGQEGETIHIEVMDQGSGIASGEFERIFERFYRGARHANSVAGSGLGLWIARALIESCGGRIRAFSNGSAGTTVRIDLPLKAQPASDEEADE
jgi:two-component system sensor histidine kinase KdpD